MTYAELSANDAAIIIGACGALVVAILAPLLKVIVDIRKQTTETNIAVNHRPKGDATLRDLVEAIGEKVESIVNRIDRVQDAVSGANARMDRIERERQEREE